MPWRLITPLTAVGEQRRMYSFWAALAAGKRASTIVSPGQTRMYRLTLDLTSHLPPVRHPLPQSTLCPFAPAGGWDFFLLAGSGLILRRALGLNLVSDESAVCG